MGWKGMTSGSFANNACALCFWLGQLDTHTLLVQADAEFLAHIVGWKAEHLARPDERVTQQQVIKHGFVGGIERYRHLSTFSNG